MLAAVLLGFLTSSGEEIDAGVRTEEELAGRGSWAGR